MKRVLILEDEKNIRELFGLLLNHWNYEVDLFHDSNEAIESVRRKKYDLAWIDYSLEGTLNGISTFNIIKSIDPDITGVLVTGCRDDDVFDNAYKKGFKRVLLKPISHIVEDILKSILS